MFSKILTTTALIGIAAGSAAYAGGYEPAPAEPVVMAPMAPVSTSGDWGGFYGGAQLGYGIGDIDPDTVENDIENDFDGAIGGLFAGYNWDLGDYVIGVEGDYNLADLAVDGSSDTIDQLGRIKLRAGLDLGQTLVYAVGGAAYANLDSTPDLSDWGYAVGAGADYQFANGLIGGVEYLYHGFDDFDNSGSDISAHTIMARVSMRF